MRSRAANEKWVLVATRWPNVWEEYHKEGSSRLSNGAGGLWLRYGGVMAGLASRLSSVVGSMRKINEKQSWEVIMGHFGPGSSHSQGNPGILNSSSGCCRANNSFGEFLPEESLGGNKGGIHKQQRGLLGSWVLVHCCENTGSKNEVSKQESLGTRRSLQILHFIPPPSLSSPPFQRGSEP